jgi:DNA-binding IclR family transcriptional regulator
VLRALHRLGGTAATADLVRRTRLPRTRVRRALRDLVAAGRIRSSGEGLQTRYHEEVRE